MPRKTTKSLVRKVSPDRKYQSIMVQRLINKSMLDGKKQAAERAVYAAIEGAAKKLNSENPVEVLEKAIANVSQILKLNLAVLVVLTIKFHSQFLDTVSFISLSLGWCNLLAHAVVCHMLSVWKPKLLML